MKKMHFLFSLILLASSPGTFAQNRVATYLDSLQKHYPKEEIYLLFNKRQYLAGETIWFSAFAFSGHEPSAISTNLFVELYDGEKKLITRKQLPLVNGQAAGQIDLSEKLNENIYFIRAYTRWMLNFPESFQYIHPVEILNPKSPKRLQLQQSPWKGEASPEGGTLVDEVPSKVAVRLSSSSPLPKKWSGYLTETGSTEKITEFSSLDQNVAEFTFLPYAG